MGSGSLILVAFSAVGYLVGIGACVGGMLTQAWFVTENASQGFNKIEEGLMKRCDDDINGNTNCKDREEILKFKSGNELEKEKDVVMVILIVSLVFGFLALLLAFSMICLRGQKSAWVCGAASQFVFGLLAVIAGIAGLAYAESEFKGKWSTSKHGWSNILCWVGIGTNILGAIMSLLQVCINPMSNGSSKDSGVHYVGNRNPTYQHDYHTNY